MNPLGVQKIDLGSSPTQPSSPISSPKKWRQNFLLVVVVLAIILSGTLTGFLLSNRTAGKIGGGTSAVAPGAETKGKEIGSTDFETFKDTAEGILEKGGVDGEGSHKLIREGGPSQTAYLTSSIIDLDNFVGKKVQIWGKTYKAQKAGWLMDVGRVKVLD